MITIEERPIPDANFQRLLSLLFQTTSTTAGEVK